MIRAALATVFLALSAVPVLAADITCADWPQTTTLADIKAKYGAKNVVTADLPGAEGETYKGTVVFPKDEAKKFTVTWWDEDKLEQFGGISIAQASTGPFGLKLGMSIADVQKINGKPFELSGFDWDYGGAPNFTGGKLGSLDGGCFVSMTFGTTKQTDEKTYNQIAGDIVIRSDMKAVAKAKPVITSLGLGWPAPSPQKATDMHHKIPVTVITGFLGAGKTTLVRHLLGHAKGKRIALIINEFGDLGVDREVIAAGGHDSCREEDMIELSNGCICCTVAEDFIPTMETLLGRDERPDHIVIETSGLALPQPLIRAFNWPEIKSAVTVDGVVTVVDAAALSEGRFAADEQAVARQRAADQMLDHATPLGELFKDQLVAADLVIVNKSDLVSEAALGDVEDRLRSEVRPGTGMIRARNGHVDIAALLGMGFASEDHLEGRDSAHELEHGGAGHEHDDFDSFSIGLDNVPGREQLLAVIEATIRAHDILRLKGWAALPGSDARLAIQAVGPRVNAWFDRPWKPGEARRTELVVIGESPLDHVAISASLRRAERAAA